MQDIPPATAQLYDMAVSEFETYLRVKDIHVPEVFVSNNLNEIQTAGLCAMRLSVTSRPPLAVQCLCANVFIEYHFQRQCGRYGR